MGDPAPVARGLTNQEMSRQLGISVRTVEKHLERAYRKLQVPSRTAALAAVRAAL
jgi:DNA-binding CsgD family transcriptional regulator